MRRQPGGEDNGAYEVELIINGERRKLVGDSHVWLWYRGTGVGPYPCMGALQALEKVSDEFIRAGVPVGRLASLLLHGAESLAMVALVVGMLVRHLKDAGELLDPFIVEPMVWRLDFNRSIQDQSRGLVATVPGIEGANRRSRSLREACMMLTMSAEGSRIEQLRRLGEQLIRTAQNDVGDDTSQAAKEHIATVRNWARSLDRSAYELKEADGGVLIQQAADPEIESILQETKGHLHRGNETVALVVRYAHRHDIGGRPSNVTAAKLAIDIATARRLWADPPDTALGASPIGPAAAAASAIELHFQQGIDVSEEDLVWCCTILFEIAHSLRDRPSNVYDHSYFPQGADRSAAFALPLLLTP